MKNKINDFNFGNLEIRPFWKHNIKQSFIGLVLLCHKGMLLPLSASSLPVHFYAAAGKTYVKQPTLRFCVQKPMSSAELKPQSSEDFRLFCAQATSPLISHQQHPSPLPTSSLRSCVHPATSAPAGLSPTPTSPCSLDPLSSGSDVPVLHVPFTAGNSPCHCQ